MQRLHVMLIPLNCLYLIDTLRYLAFFYQSTPSCLKVVGGWGGNLLLDHVGLLHVLVLTVHLVNLLGWIGKGDHSRYLATLLLKIRVN